MPNTRSGSQCSHIPTAIGGNLVGFGCMYNTQKFFVIKFFLRLILLLHKRYCKRSDQNQRQFMLHMWCVSALEVCRASSQNHARL